MSINRSVLTIDGTATLQRLKNDRWSIRSYAKARGMNYVTLHRILSVEPGTAYPYQSDPYSKFQAYLRQLQADGYLVERSQQDQAA